MSTSSPALSFSGVGSGLDTASMVSALMQLERQPLTKIQNTIKQVNTEKNVVQELNGYLSTLRTKAQALFSDTSSVVSMKATSGDDKLLSATASTSAASASYNVNVSQLAQTHTMASTAGATLTAGNSLDVTVGGKTVSIGVQAGETLQSFADRINKTDGVGAQASVINDRLVFVSKSTGSAGEVTLGGSAAAALGATTTQAAQDAKLTINGVAVTSSSNDVSDAVTGVSLSLKAQGSTVVTVGNDDTAITKKVQDFVDAYNNLQSNISKVTAYDAATKTAGTLQGDSLFREIQSQFRGVLGNAVQGQPDGRNTMFDLGLDTTRDGQITLDAGKLSEALKADPDALRKVFGASDGDNSSTSAADGIARQIDDLAKQFSQGSIADRLTGYGSRVRDLNDRIDRMNDTLATREARLKAQFAAMDSAIAQMNNQAASFLSKMRG